MRLASLRLITPARTTSNAALHVPSIRLAARKGDKSLIHCMLDPVMLGIPLPPIVHDGADDICLKNWHATLVVHTQE